MTDSSTALNSYGSFGEPTQDLLRAAQRGDTAAWRSLDERYRSILTMFMRGRIPAAARRRFDTDDLLQSTFLSAFRELEHYQYQGEGSFLSWLTKVLERRLQQRLRTAHSAGRDARREAPLQESSVPPHAGARAGTPSEAATRAEDHARLLESVAALEPDRRQIVQAYFFDRQSLTKIADDMGLNVKTVRRRLEEAMDALTRRLR